MKNKIEKKRTAEKKHKKTKKITTYYCLKYKEDEFKGKKLRSMRKKILDK